MTDRRPVAGWGAITPHCLSRYNEQCPEIFHIQKVKTEMGGEVGEKGRHLFHDCSWDKQRKRVVGYFRFMLDNIQQFGILQE